MHRHGYKGRKFGRQSQPRLAMIKSLTESLIEYESIETTLPKAKEVVRYTEKLITKAKKGDLHSRRQIIASLHTKDNAHKLVDGIAPQLGARPSGYLKIEKTKLRRGDNAMLAKISFVDDLKANAPKTKASPKKAAKPKAKTAKKSAQTTDKKPNLPIQDQKIIKPTRSNKTGPTVRHTRSGER